MENIQENNKLISEFMGLDYESNPREFEIQRCLNNGSIKKPFTDSLKYHTSWDWLMPVVERCKEKQIFGSQRLIDNIDVRLLKLDLLGVYKNVISFIEFYNE